MSDASGPPPLPAGRIDSHLGTEFGDVLAELVTAVPGALGAVLSDRDGHAVDFALDPARLDALDLQIIGAQLGQALARTHDTAVRHLIGTASVGEAVLVEGNGGALLGTIVDPDDRTVIVLVLAPHAAIGRALVHFDRARAAIATLLR